MADRTGSIAGGLLVIGGIAMAVTARGFPSIPIMPYGAGFFPTIVAGGLILSGLGMLAERGAAGPAPEPLRRGAVLRMTALAGIIAFFALTLTTLGFHVAAFVSLVAAVRIFGGGWPTVAILSPVATILLHALFYNVLRVPLPWGLLTPVAW